MSNLDKLIERAHEKRNMDIYNFIMTEHLDTYELGHEDILYADMLNNVTVPCYDFMILARERIGNGNNIVAEYAIYSQHDNDGKKLMNSLNMNATYILEYVGEETFDNMAAAIAYAFDLVSKLHKNGQEKK